ncbi:hypothetical protein AC578_4971 [Pseudocercospora eumusae]|uniref:Uncharacterized protein n=1 Tax=Pseudocercospora eumusae TaxID=321146 RepID=A0A139GTL8_9PEZI|nr:hypothetical protein AC578_4971 [Pseudocercospora eumusae]KXS93546.1 hypothetical protein AC578_4971 [Pseudocercospora eumusae]
MAVVGLKLVITAQEVLRKAGIPSAVTGDVGLSYHGVDIVTHDIELCISACQRKSSLEALHTRPDLYEALPDLLAPSFYHPYKFGAARFKVLNVDEPFELHLIEDSMLGLRLTPTLLEQGLCFANMHPQLQDLCEDIDDDAELAAITWPSLAGFLCGWLRLAETNKLSETSMIYLMQAERLIDANDEIDEDWLERNVKEPACCEQAKKLLKGKTGRIMQSTWD